ncbi:hypothetical protein [Phytohabitans rumicis]|uniref:hypothetical protein n=1 Tax=Phytohabitans rumicis TaxID=1076125 RepID=UPI0015677B25|nr:hypothetical protein [Phytohabitans rumicis]
MLPRSCPPGGAAVDDRRPAWPIPACEAAELEAQLFLASIDLARRHAARAVA